MWLKHYKFHWTKAGKGERAELFLKKCFFIENTWVKKERGGGGERGEWQELLLGNKLPVRKKDVARPVPNLNTFLDFKSQFKETLNWNKTSSCLALCEKSFT